MNLDLESRCKNMETRKLEVISMVARLRIELADRNVSQDIRVAREALLNTLTKTLAFYDIEIGAICSWRERRN